MPAADRARRSKPAAGRAKLSKLSSGEEQWLGDLPLGVVRSKPASREAQIWLGDMPLGPVSSDPGQAAGTSTRSPNEPNNASTPAAASEALDLAERDERHGLANEEPLTEERDPGDASAAVPSTDSDDKLGASAEMGEDATPSAKLPGRARRALVDNFVAVILGVVAVGLAVALALAMVQLGNKSATDNAGASALTAAKSYSVELAAYDYRHLDKDFGVVLAHSTQSFRRSFTQSSNALKSTLTKYHATSKAKVVAAGLISASTSRAVALVFLDQTVTNSTQKGTTTDRSQVEITLVDTGGHWLIDQVTLP
jgi:Mce-associated membrane protein